MPQTRFDLSVSRRGILGMAGTLALSASAASAASVLTAGETDMPATIEAIVGRAMKEGPFPGLVVAIEKGGRTIYRRAFGQADLENALPVTPDMVFPIGSVTKTMTGLSAMQLVAAGKIGLDDPASRWIDGLPPAVGEIRLRNLLDHTSGLVAYTDAPGFPRDSQRPFTRDEVVGWFKDLPLQFAPGSRWSYTNSGTYLMGLVIEKASGMDYGAYLKHHIFEPFGMTHSSTGDWRTLLPGRAHGYVPGKAGLENAPRYDPLVPFSAGMVLSTADDMMRYRRGVFGDGPTSAEVRRLILQRDRLSSGTELPYSLGCLAVTRFEGHRKIGHPGDIFGFSSQYAWYPDDDVTIIILANIQGGAIPIVSLEQKIARAALGLPQPVILDRRLPSAEAARYAGSYEIGEIRFAVAAMRFFLEDGALNVSFGHGDAPGLPLRYQGNGVFVSRYDDEHRFRFTGSGARRSVAMDYYGSTFLAAIT
ncbi:MAG: serine hydrolase domain-containing protein [Pseudomonadota bacterium]